MTTLRRNLKNTVNNYTDIQCKVREATSNEPWGPAPSVMCEIADSTYSVVEFAEIMSMLWKRLNDHGKNWRHVYKALVVLDYIIKTGSERVAQQCKEQIYSLITLNEFRFLDKDGKDAGSNVREKAKQVVALLKDEERLKAERKKALQAKERIAQNSAGIGSSASRQPKTTGTLGGLIPGSRSSEGTRDGLLPRLRNSNSTSSDQRISAALEQARPSDRDEEEMQLELALAISKEEAQKAKEEDDLMVKALERSKTETKITNDNRSAVAPSPKPTLLSIAQQPLDPWGIPLDLTTFPGPVAPPDTDPWAPSKTTNTTVNLLDTSIDTGTYMHPPLSHPPLSQPPLSQPVAPMFSDPWSSSSSTVLQPAPSHSADLLLGDLQAFDPFGPAVATSRINANTPPQIPPHIPSSSTTLPPASKMATILDNRTKHLVNIDNLISTPTPTIVENTNPFGASDTATSSSVFSAEYTNPFVGNQAQQPTLNQLRGPPHSVIPKNPTNPFC